MSNVARVASTAANVLTTPLNIEDVFSTFLDIGDGSGSLTINSGIDLATEGGIVWNKSRDGAYHYNIFDPSLGTGAYLQTSNTTSLGTGANYSFTTTGLTDAYNNVNGNSLVWWTFRKAPKFFDIQTWSGDDTTGRTISHNLRCQAGLVLIKDITGSGTEWVVAHHSEPTKVGYMTDIAFFTAGYVNTLTSSSFTLGDTIVNSTGRDYVAYIWAHNDSDGEFGPDGDADIIKCGTFTGAGATEVSISLGFEPQWFMVKKTSATDDWYIIDVMRGQPVGSNVTLLSPNTTSAEQESLIASPTPDGLTTKNFGSGDYIYVAIRRGPMATPTSATDVFAIDTFGNASSTAPAYEAGFPVDTAMTRNISLTANMNITSRLTSNKFMRTNLTSVEASNSNYSFDYQNGWGSYAAASNTSSYSWMWKRAPKFFEMVTWTGDGTASRQITHNLGATPQWVLLRPRDAISNWLSWFAPFGDDHYFTLTEYGRTDTGAFFNTADSTSFTLGTGTSMNNTGVDHIAWLFGSLAGISKVGTYTGNGTNQNIDCGFSSGARFVLIRQDVDEFTTSNWCIYDTSRGLVAGNDKRLQLNTTDSEDTDTDSIDPYSAGFNVVQESEANLNVSGQTYVFYAIA